MLRTIIVLAGLFCALTFSEPAAAGDHCRGSICFQAKARTKCLKPAVWSILHRLTAEVGPIEVTSGCDGRHARNSLHYSGRAADIRALHVPQGVAAAHLRRMPGVGGLGIEGRGLLHVDVGGEITWRDFHRPRTRYAGGHRQRFSYHHRRHHYASLHRHHRVHYAYRNARYTW
jgi:hypothetical protein